MDRLIRLEVRDVLRRGRDAVITLGQRVMSGPRQHEHTHKAAVKPETNEDKLMSEAF